MKKKLTSYISELESDISKGTANQEELLVHIGFYQHERLVHLVVTVLFAILEMISIVFTCLSFNMTALVLTILFLVLLIPYISHYYFLENSVQKLYELYDVMTKKGKTK